MTTPKIHSFHIPVMGTAFTIDTPIKLAKFGIASVMSIGDDELCETMRAHYCTTYNMPYDPIKKWEDDYRARRITAYLNLVHDIVESQIITIKAQSFEPDTEITQYFELLNDDSPLKHQYLAMQSLTESPEKRSAQDALRQHIMPGSMDVNIMTKLDRMNYTKHGDLMSEEFSDALSALRGYANSKLESSIVFSAGFNRRLYAYVEKFSDFFPDQFGKIKKKIILKVSDFRSSLTQGKFLAKKGVWVSEHRIESGLNCGGHAFATDGFLLGPILEEFNKKRVELVQQLKGICNTVLAEKGRHLLPDAVSTRVTVQGGIGTSAENRFLFRRFNVDATGWGTPFLLVPEATTLDDVTLQQLAQTTPDDMYLSGISPLGVPFNTFKGSPSEKMKLQKAADGKPGSPCPKGHLVSNTEFTSKPICTASVTYQKKKLAELDTLNLDLDARSKAYTRIIDKACLCEDLAAGALIVNGIENKRILATAVCPGPNLAYFDKVISLKEMVDHIYGKTNVMSSRSRPNMFMAELNMYIEYLRREVAQVVQPIAAKQGAYLCAFRDELRNGISFYTAMIQDFIEESDAYRQQMVADLHRLVQDLSRLETDYHAIFAPQAH